MNRSLAYYHRNRDAINAKRRARYARSESGIGVPMFQTAAVKAIRSSRGKSIVLATVYGCSPNTITQIRRRERYARVT